MREDSSTVEPEVEGPVLDGVWLRRERERIAIGRRQVAARLGLPESRVTRIEMNQLPIPAEWFTALAGLGFPVPAELIPAATAAETTDPTDPTHLPTTVDDPAPVESARVAAEPDSPPLPSPAVTTSGLDVTSDASAMRIAPAAAPNSAFEPVATIPDRAAIASAPIAEPNPAPIVTPAVVEVPVGSDPPTAPRMEPAAVPSDASPIYTGHWLRRERKRRGMMHIAIAPALPVTAAELASAEAQDSPLPLHWLPSLRRLGLPISEAAAALAAQSAPSPQITPPPSSMPIARAQSTARAPRAASTSTRADSKPLTGAWLRQARVERSITQSWLSQLLNVNQTKVWRCESENQTLPPRWLPILRHLGFMTNSPASAGSSTALPAAAAISGSTENATHAAAGPTIDGRWLKSERDRLGLSVRAVRLQLRVAASTYERLEGSRARVPRFWWAGLRQLGMRLPATPPALPSQITPYRGPFNGAWLVRERKRLRLTQYEVCRAVQANARMLRRIEREADELPRAWLAKLPLLGIAVDIAAAQRSQIRNPPRPTQSAGKKTPTGPQPVAANPTASQTIKLGSSAPAARPGADLVALIVNFRLALGQHTKQPPFEILSRILSDLREAGADQTLTPEDVDRAARALIRKP